MHTDPVPSAAIHRLALWAPVWLLALTALLLTACTPDRAARIDPVEGDWNEYAAKVVCGTVLSTTSPDITLNVGRYFTSVNIHNPSLTEERRLWFKAVQALQHEAQGEPSPFTPVVLAPDAATRIDCSLIRDLMRPPLDRPAEGWVVIVSPDEFDVAEVHSAGSTGTIYPVRSIDVERVEPRAIFAPPAELLGEADLGLGACPGAEGCCCNSVSAAGQVFGDCNAGLECKRLGFSPSGASVNTCTPIGRPRFVSQLASSEPPFCGSP